MQRRLVKLKSLMLRQAAKGDTIVEVLMSIAIVGAVIAGAYALASRSLAEGVSASEHSQAIKMAESQVEALKSRSKDSRTRITDIWNPNFDIRANPIPDNLNNFCLDTEATSMLDAANAVQANWKPQYNGNGSAGFTGNNMKATTVPAVDTYNPVCTDTGSPVSAKYFINIKLLHTANSPTYLVTVRWTPAGKAPTSQTQLYYRF
jgi:type II secretory pathway pseudopilin PulG